MHSSADAWPNHTSAFISRFRMRITYTFLICVHGKLPFFYDFNQIRILKRLFKFSFRFIWNEVECFSVTLAAFKSIVEQVLVLRAEPGFCARNQAESQRFNERVKVDGSRICIGKQDCFRKTGVWISPRYCCGVNF